MRWTLRSTGDLKEGNVPLPAWCPLDGLLGKTFFGAGEQHVERCESTDSGSAEAKNLRGPGLGDTDRHVDSDR